MAAKVLALVSPVSLPSGDEVPHIFTRKSRLRPGKFLITGAKRVLQQNLTISRPNDPNRKWSVHRSNLATPLSSTWVQQLRAKLVVANFLNSIATHSVVTPILASKLCRLISIKYSPTAEQLRSSRHAMLATSFRAYLRQA